MTSLLQNLGWSIFWDSDVGGLTSKHTSLTVWTLEAWHADIPCLGIGCTRDTVQICLVYGVYLLWLRFEPICVYVEHTRFDMWMYLLYGLDLRGLTSNIPCLTSYPTRGYIQSCHNLHLLLLASTSLPRFCNRGLLESSTTSNTTICLIYSLST